MVKYFYAWKAVLKQEKIVEIFDPNEIKRSNLEIEAHNKILKCTRAIFRFYSRKITESFYLWKYIVADWKKIQEYDTIKEWANKTKRSIQQKDYTLSQQKSDLETLRINNNQQKLYYEHEKMRLSVRLASSMLKQIFDKRRHIAF